MSALRSSNLPPAPAPMLVPVGQHQGQRPLPLGRLFTLIGSSPSARLYLPSKAVSRCHAVIINTGGGLFVRDLASRTHTRINGRAVAESELREGDVLQVGGFTFRFTDPTAPKVKPPAPPAPAAALEVDGLDQPLPIQDRTVLIGRRDTADISLTENAASSAHVLLFVAEGKHLIRDLNSRTGTFVNGVKVNEHALSPGDVLRVGETEFRYVRTFAAPAPAGEVSAEPSADPSAATAESAPHGAPPTHPTEDGEESNAAKGELADAGDFDFVAEEVAPDTMPEAAEAHIDSAADAPDARGAPTASSDPGGSAVGLLEMGESSREDVLKDDPADAIISPSEMLEQPREAPAPQPPEQPADSGKVGTQPTTPAADREPIELALADETAVRQAGDDDQLKLELSDEAPATPPTPALAPPTPSPDPAVAPVQQRRRWSAKKTVESPAPPPRQAPPTSPPPPPASKQRPDSRPDKNSPVRGKIPSFGQRPARPRSPFDVLGAADELEPLPELPPEDLPPAPPRTGRPGNTPSKD